MLLAPFTAIDTPASRPASRGRPENPVPRWLLAWAVIGGMAVVCVPDLRGGPAGGWTLPFWLAVAPVLDILWLTRRSWLKAGLRKAATLTRHGTGVRR